MWLELKLQAKVRTLAAKADVDSNDNLSSFSVHTAFRARYTLKFMFYKSQGNF